MTVGETFHFVSRQNAINGPVFREGRHHRKHSLAVEQVNRDNRTAKRAQHSPDGGHQRFQFCVVFGGKEKRRHGFRRRREGNGHFHNHAEVPLAEKPVEIGADAPLEKSVHFLATKFAE